MPPLTHSALSWSFFPLLFFLLFPLCYSKLLSLSCFLFLFFASRFASPVCCHPWLFMALQNFSVPFHLAGAQPLSIHRSFLVAVGIFYRNLSPLFCTCSSPLQRLGWAVALSLVQASGVASSCRKQVTSCFPCPLPLEGCAQHRRQFLKSQPRNIVCLQNLVFYMLHFSVVVVVVYKTIWECDLWEEGALQRQHSGFHRQQLVLSAVTIQINTLHLLCSFHCWRCQQFISGACSELLSGRQKMQLLVIRL